MSRPKKINKTKINIDGKDIKLTDKKIKLLDVLSDPNYKKDTLTSKLKRIGMTHQYYYQLMKDSEFLKLLKLRNISTVVSYSPHIIKSVIDKAMSGNYMQQKLALEMSGDYTPQSPLINILIDNSNAVRSENELDKEITSLFNPIDITKEDNTNDT